MTKTFTDPSQGRKETWARGRCSGVEDMQGAVLQAVQVDGEDSITFYADDGRAWKMHHYQECCESVTIEDICGDVQDLIGDPLAIAEESTTEGPAAHDCEEWTFYKLGTVNADVTIRWYGVSNGYYSTSVDFGRVVG